MFMDRKKLFKLVVSRLREQGAKKVAVFGSYARREEKKGSDIDVMVRFVSKKSLLDLVRIERELSEEAGVKVDLLTEKSISPLILRGVRKEMEVLYG
jgi:predicted nucleotidyltransferase